MAIDDKDFERWKAEAAELDPKCDYTDNYAVEVMALACEALPQLLEEVERLREAAQLETREGQCARNIREHGDKGCRQCRTCCDFHRNREVDAHLEMSNLERRLRELESHASDRALSIGLTVDVRSVDEAIGDLRRGLDALPGDVEMPASVAEVIRDWLKGLVRVEVA